MRRKPLPPPPDDLQTVAVAQSAVPLVPHDETDCCSRLQGRLGLPGRDDAATWLDFLRALGLVREGPAGFTRVRDAPGPDDLAETFVQTVFGAREVLETLEAADGSLEAAAVADRIEDAATAWERGRHGGDWEMVWQERTADLLEWLVLFDALERTAGGYRPASNG